MESMEPSKPRPRRSFTPEFKAEIVELCQRGDRSIGRVARDVDLTKPDSSADGHPRPPPAPALCGGPTRPTGSPRPRPHDQASLCRQRSAWTTRRTWR